MLQKMARIQVIGPREDIAKAIDVLYQEGTLHLEDVTRHTPSSEIILRRISVDKATEVADILGKITGILSTLPRREDDRRQKEILEAVRGKTQDQVLLQASMVIAELESTTKDLAAKKSERTFSVTALNRYEKVIRTLQPIEHELPTLEGFEVTILLIQKEYQEVLGLIRSELEQITGNRFEMSHMSVDEETLAAIMVFGKQHSEEVHSFIFSVNVNEIRLPSEYMGMSFDEMLLLIAKNRLIAEEDLKEAEKQLTELSVARYQELSVLKRVLEDWNDELQAYANFAHSDYTFVVMGWLPKKSLKKMREALDREFMGRVVVNELNVTCRDMEEAPTFYDNPWFVKPFEFFMRLVSPPRYHEVDPVPLLAIFFPIFFGIMVGDVGYGLVILGFAVFMRKKFHQHDWLVQLMNIMIISSIPAIFFGFLFGEFFGDFGEMIHLMHPIEIFGITWNRVEAMIPLLVLTIAIGVIHVFTGLIIGILNAITAKSKKHVSEKAGMLLAITGIIIVLTILAGFLPDVAFWPGVITVIAAMPLILYGAGVFGTLEIMSTVGNILSYARLMAIGMASVILAMVANRLGGAMEVVIVGIIIAVLLHALNILLAMFSPSLHSIRLHLVECYSKFYTGGGIVYRPFKKGDEGTLRPA